MIRSFHFALACLVLLSGTAWGWQPKDAEKQKPAPTQEELEKEFVQQLRANFPQA